jgi:exosortase
MIKFISCLALLLLAYVPAFYWMAQRWFGAESYYGHGPLIPLVSLFIVWQRRKELRRTWDVRRKMWDVAGLWIVITMLLVHIVCTALRVGFVSGFTFAFALYGLVLFFFGKKMARQLTFPIFFLLAMVPLPLVLISGITVKLKLFATAISTFILNRIGFPSIQDGNVIIMPNSRILIEAPCSGLRSLISLLTLGMLFAYFISVRFWKRALIFLSSIPIAMATNILRILILAAVNDLYGEKIAMGFVHDASGFLVFALAFLALLGVGKALEKSGVRVDR